MSGDGKDTLSETDILVISDAYSQADASRGSAHRRRSGQFTEICVSNIELEDKDVKPRMDACSMILSICKESCVALLKFADLLRFLGHVLPFDEESDVEITLDVVNESNNSRMV